MAADVYIAIADPATRAVVAQRWVGWNRVRDCVHEVLVRPPDHEAVGFASWGRVTESEARRISEAHYAEGTAPVVCRLGYRRRRADCVGHRTPARLRMCSECRSVAPHVRTSESTTWPEAQARGRVPHT